MGFKYPMGLRNKKILLTCGPTWVAIDPVRVISNCSTGTLGHLLAKALKAKHAQVTVLEGPVNCSLKSHGVRVKKFKLFSDLATLLCDELKKKYDVVIHAAAVADYQPRTLAKSKLSSGKRELILRLTPTPKLINHIKKIAPKTFLVGFKLESTSQRAALVKAANKLITDSGCDLVVANSSNQGYQGYIIDQKSHVMATASSRQNLTTQLIRILDKKL